MLPSFLNGKNDHHDRDTKKEEVPYEEFVKVLHLLFILPFGPKP
jgi:hypothetical protein